MRKSSGFLIFLALFTVVLAGCLSKTEPRGTTYIDDIGNDVVIDGTPEKIVTLTPGLTEIVFYLNAGDKIVGCDSASNYPGEAEDIEKVSTWEGPDTEKILALSPDLILMDKNLDSSGDNYDKLKDLGIPIYRIYPLSIDDTLEVMRDLADILDTDSESESKIKTLEERVGTVRNSVSDIVVSDRPSVLHVTYYEEGSDPWVMTDSTFSGDIISTAGGDPSVKDPKGLAIQISVERFLELDPDIILTSQSSIWPTNSREYILNDEAMEGISAVEEGRVYDIEGDWMDRTGPRMIEGLEAVNGHIEEFVEGS